MTQEIFQEEDAGQRRPKPRRRGRKAIFIIMASMVVLVGGALVAALMYLNSLGDAYDDQVQTFEPEETFPEESERPPKEEDDDSLNVLLLGADSGGGSGEDEELPTVPGGARSDTMMLVHVPGDRESMQVMSIMRDTWVPVPGHGEAKINAALTLGGIPLTVQTVESLLDVRIDHVASIDLAGFQGLVGAMGGVTVDSPEAFESRAGYSFSAGEQHLDAEQAMAFVRERRAFGDGDYTRVRNQQVFIRGVLDGVLSPSTLTNPGRVHEMVETFSPYMVVDHELDSGTVGSLGWELRNVGEGGIDMLTMPNLGLGTSADGQSIVIHDAEAAAEIGGALRDDEFQEYVQSR